MTPINVAVHGSGIGTCCLSGKECDGITVTFEDGTVKAAFLSWKSFRQLLALKSAQTLKPDPRPPAALPVNGPPMGTAK